MQLIIPLGNQAFFLKQEKNTHTVFKYRQVRDRAKRGTPDTDRDTERMPWEDCR